jgi:antitoxin VapB
MVDIYPQAVPRYPYVVALNIKNEDTVAAARELAALTGESITQAIDTAVRERLNSLHAAEDARRARLRALLTEMRVAWGPRDGGDPTAFLYDEETGLPV